MTTREVREEGSKMEEVYFPMHAEVVVLSCFWGTARVLLVAVRLVVRRFFGPLC